MIKILRHLLYFFPNWWPAWSTSTEWKIACCSLAASTFASTSRFKKSGEGPLMSALSSLLVIERARSLGRRVKQVGRRPLSFLSSRPMISTLGNEPAESGASPGRRFHVTHNSSDTFRLVISEGTFPEKLPQGKWSFRNPTKLKIPCGTGMPLKSFACKLRIENLFGVFLTPSRLDVFAERVLVWLHD